MGARSAVRTDHDRSNEDHNCDQRAHRRKPRAPRIELRLRCFLSATCLVVARVHPCSTLQRLPAAEPAQSATANGESFRTSVGAAQPLSVTELPVEVAAPCPGTSVAIERVRHRAACDYLAHVGEPVEAGGHRAAGKGAVAELPRHRLCPSRDASVIHHGVFGIRTCGDCYSMVQSARQMPIQAGDVLQSSPMTVTASATGTRRSSRSHLPTG
jgi:hypothetical protein